MARVAVVFPLLVAVVAGLWLLGRRASPHARTARLGAALVADVPATDATRALLQRWRDRAVRWRLTAAAPAVAAAVVAGVVATQRVRIGVGDGPAWTDPLLLGMLGSFAGAAGAELHRLRRPTHGRRAAALTPRELDAYLPSGSRTRLAVLAAVLVLVSLAAARVAGIGSTAPGILGMVVLALVPVVQRRVVTRPRPAVDAELVAADDALRRLAVRALDDAGAGAALLLAAWQSVRLSEVEILAIPLFVGQVATFVTVIVWWRRSAPHRLLPDVDAALARTAREHAP